MNRLKKNIIVRFFSIQATGSFFNGFVSAYVTNNAGSNSSRVFNIRSKKYLIKISDEYKYSKVQAYSVTVVRERNTWQTKASSDGTITGITTNQGIIGDPYFFLVVPKKKVLLGFTSGPSGSLKGVGKTMLEQFNSDRAERVSLNLIPKEKEFATLQELPEYASLHFKINSSSFSDITDDAPELIKNLSSAPYIENNMQLILDLDCSTQNDKNLSKESVIEIVNYLSDHDGCTVLKVKGINDDGTPIHLDFANAFFNYKTEIITRNKFIEEKDSAEVLNAALLDYLNKLSS